MKGFLNLFLQNLIGDSLMDIEKTEVCSYCGKLFTKDDLVEFENVMVCKECKDKVVICENCDEIIAREDSLRANGYNYCRDCFNDNFVYCDDCGDLIEMDNAYFSESNNCYYCNDCYRSDDECDCDDDGDSFWDLSLEDKPKITKDFSTFGIELETIASDEADVNAMSTDGWKCVYDSSIRGRGREFVSPILTGNNGLIAVKDFVKRLNEDKYRVDSSCGIHVHYGLTTGKIKDYLFLNALMIGYKEVEHWIYDFIAPSRRTLSFCKPIDTNFLYESFAHPVKTKVTNFKHRFYGTQQKNALEDRERYHYYDKRYYGLNIHSIFFRGTVEIRYHNGSLNFEKIKNWIKINQTILNYIYKNRKHPILLKKLKSIDSIEKNKILSKNLIKYIKERTKSFET